MGFIRNLARFLQKVYCPVNNTLYIIWHLQGMTCLLLSISGSPHHYSPCKKWHVKCKDQQSWKGNDGHYSQNQSPTAAGCKLLPGHLSAPNLIQKSFSLGLRQNPVQTGCLFTGFSDKTAEKAHGEGRLG